VARRQALSVRIAVPTTVQLVSAADGAMFLQDDEIGEVVDLSSELALCSSGCAGKGAFASLPALSSAEAALVARFDVCPDELYPQIHAAATEHSPRGIIAVFCHDLDFPDVEPVLFTVPALKWAKCRTWYECYQRFSRRGSDSIEVFTCQAAVGVAPPIGLRDMETLLQQLPTNTAVSCVFRRKPASVRFLNVHDLTDHGPPRTYKVCCPTYGKWSHRQTLECIECVGATHIRPATNPYRFYLSPRKEDAVPIYLQRDTSISPPDDLYLFMDPSSAPYELGQIFVKGLDGKTTSFKINVPDISCWGLKKMVQEEFGILVDDQRLIFGGGQLEVGRMCSDYGLVTETTVHLMLRLRGD
jgi:large subunit ribosomal protein L40e